MLAAALIGRGLTDRELRQELLFFGGEAPGETPPPEPLDQPEGRLA